MTAGEIVELVVTGGPGLDEATAERIARETLDRIEAARGVELGPLARHGWDDRPPAGWGYAARVVR